MTGERLAAIQQLAQDWLAVDDFDALVPAPCVVCHRQEPYKTHFEHPQYGHPLFEQLNSEPEIIRVVAGLLQGCPRLFHSTLTSMAKAAAGDAVGGFHRDDSGFRFAPGFRNPHNDYQSDGGEIYCSHISTWLALADVPEETGFCLCPGTHRSNFHEPPGLLCQHDPPTSITLPMAAGDVAIFSTALLHDAAAWTEDYPRLNMFQRYTLSAYFQE